MEKNYPQNIPWAFNLRQVTHALLILYFSVQENMRIYVKFLHLWSVESTKSARFALYPLQSCSVENSSPKAMKHRVA